MSKSLLGKVIAAPSSSARFKSLSTLDLEQNKP